VPGLGAGSESFDGKEYLDALQQRAYCSGIVIFQVVRSTSKTSRDAEHPLPPQFARNKCRLCRAVMGSISSGAITVMFHSARAAKAKMNLQCAWRVRGLPDRPGVIRLLKMAYHGVTSVCPKCPPRLRVCQLDFGQMYGSLHAPTTYRLGN